MTEPTPPLPWIKWFQYLSILNLLLIVVAIIGRITLDWQPMLSFRLFFYAIQFGLGMAVIALFLLAWCYFKKAASSIKPVIFGLLNSLLPVLVSLLIAGPSLFSLPLIHDISTDTLDPPVFYAAVSLRTADENSLEYERDKTKISQQEAAYPDIQPLLSAMPPKTAFTHALNTSSALGWTLIDSGLDETSAVGSLEAFEQTAIFGFIDDVSIRIKPENGGSRIDIRSVSRLGLGDLGANANRIRKFIRKFNE